VEAVASIQFPSAAVRGSLSRLVARWGLAVFDTLYSSRIGGLKAIDDILWNENL
jgi:hypothetical protein